MNAGADLTVRDVMSAGAHSVVADDPIDDVYRLMKLGGIRHLPVLEDGRLVGVVSDRDILTAWSQGPETRVERVMTRVPRWIAIDAPARDAARLLLRHKIGCLPVVDANMNVVGIVTETDFLELAHRALSPPSSEPFARPS